MLNFDFDTGTFNVRSLKAHAELSGGITKVNSLMENFNFERLHKNLKKIGWTWATERGQRVPTVMHIMTLAERLLLECLYIAEVTGADHVQSTGGLQATASVDGLNQITLELQFVMEEWFSF